MLYLPPEQVEEIKLVAERTRRSRQSILREAVDYILERYAHAQDPAATPAPRRPK
jgi:hypothetical protein